VSRSIEFSVARRRVLSLSHARVITSALAVSRVLVLAGVLVVAGSLTAQAQGADLPASSWRTHHAAFEPGDGSAPSHPPSAFTAGRRGRALRLGPGSGPAELAARGVVDLARPGAITCWIQPVAWRPPGPSSEYVPVIRVIGSGAAVALVERDRRYAGRDIDVWIAGFFSLASRAEVQLQRELDGAWPNAGWHFVAFQWDATGFSLQLDGRKPARMALPGADLAAEFPKETSTLLIGSGASEGFLVDEVSVWSRPLSQRELSALRSH
jgi:Concanavalin A-like lectin/glucanases superfamily